jgi:lysozyme
MKLSSTGTALLKQFEGLRLKAYQCSAGRWTIGYGHTGQDVRPGDVITAEKAEALLAWDVKRFELDVESLVKVPVSQNQFDALVCFAFNVGSDIDADVLPEGLGDSTLLKYVNAHKFALAAGEFLKWNKATVGGKRIIVLGLVRRRKAESELFSRV